MSMTAFEIFGVLKLNKDSFKAGLEAAEEEAKGAGSKVGGYLKSGAQIGLAALAAGTTAAIGFSKTAVQAGSAFDQAMGGVAATMGKSVEDLNDNAQAAGKVSTAYGEFEGTLREFAMFMGQNTVFSATQAASALNYMALAGYDVNESMQMLPSVLSMAAAGGMDLALASDMITDTQMALGISFERTQQMVDEFAKAASSGNTNVEQLGEAFLRVGGLARELNGGLVTLPDGTEVAVDGVQELEAAFTAMANRGIKGAEAGTHMRNMLLKLSAPTDDGAVALQQLGVAVFDDTGKMRALSDIFGDMSRNMENIIPVFQETYNKIQNMSSDELAKAMEEGSIRIRNFGIDLLGENDALRDWNDIMEDINNTFAENGALTQEQRIGLISDMFNTRDLASAEGLLAAMTEDFAPLTANILEASGAAEKMSQTKLDNLTGDMTLFRSALETAQITLNDQLNPSIRDFVQIGTKGLQDIVTGFNEGGLEGAMAAVGDTISNALNTIIDKLPTFIEAGGALIGTLVNGLFDNLDSITDAAIVILEQLANGLVVGLPKLIEAFNRVLTQVFTSVEENTDGLIEMVLTLAQNIATAIQNTAPQLVSAIGNLFKKLLASLVNNLPQILTFIVDSIKQFVGYIMENLPMIIEALQELIPMLITALSENIPMLVESAVEIIMMLTNGLIESLPLLLDMMPVILQALVDAIVNNLPIIFEASISIINALISGFIQLLPQLIPVAVQMIFTLINGLISAIPSLIGAIPQLIMAIVTGLMSGIPDILASGVELVAKLLEGILSTVGTLLMAGPQLIVELIKGLVNGAGQLLKAGGDIVDRVWEGFKGMVGGAVEWGKDLIGNFIDGLKKKWEDLKKTVKDIAGSIKDFLGFSEPEDGPLSNFHTYAPDMMDLFAKGIRDNKAMLQNTVADAFDFKDVISDTNVGVNADMGDLDASGGASTGSVGGDIVIPVYIGDKLLDEIIVESQKRVNMRSGGVALV